MTAIASLIDPDTARRLARVRDEAEQLEQAAAAVPVQPVCKTCGQRLPVPGAVFNDGTDR